MMGTAEKVGIGVAIACVGGLLALMIATRPDVPDIPVRPGQHADLGGKRIATISEGDQVDIADYLKPGSRTVVEFTAEW